jgi:alpha-tubulin suppressor-like RCC1 family protein
MGRPELDSLQLNPVVRWVKTFEDEDQPTIYYNKQETKMKDGSSMTCAYVDYHSKNRVTVEVSEDVLTGNTKTYESVASWLTENVKGNNLQNMLVCLKAELPPLKQIASGHFHAAALTEDGKALVWGKGSLGRLG